MTNDESMFECSNSRNRSVWSFEHSSFEFVSSFVIRISSFSHHLVPDKPQNAQQRECASNRRHRQGPVWRLEFFADEIDVKALAVRRPGAFDRDAVPGFVGCDAMMVPHFDALNFP